MKGELKEIYLMFMNEKSQCLYNVKRPCMLLLSYCFVNKPELACFMKDRHMALAPPLSHLTASYSEAVT